MVTCQSANQLKTPAQVSWAFKMVSQFGSLGFTIMGKTADLTVVQLTIIESQTFIAKKSGCSQSAVSKHVNRKLSGRKKCGRKNSQPTERTAALWGLSSNIDTRIWVNFTRNGLRLGSRHQEPRHTDVSRNLATVVVFLEPLLNHRQCQRRLTWAKEKKNWTVAQWSKVLFWGMREALHSPE